MMALIKILKNILGPKEHLEAGPVSPKPSPSSPFLLLAPVFVPVILPDTGKVDSRQPLGSPG